MRRSTNTFFVCFVCGSTEDCFDEICETKCCAEAIDVTNVENHLPLSEIEMGLPLQKRFKRKDMHPDIVKKHLLSAWSFYITTALHLMKNLPLNNQLLEALSCLHPRLRLTAKGVEHIKLIAESVPCIEQKDLAVTDEWKLYSLEEIPGSWHTKDG